jgi:hypothetical protein
LEGDDRARAAVERCDSARVDEEIFVILDGQGTLELWPSPARTEQGQEKRRTPSAPAT